MDGAFILTPVEITTARVLATNVVETAGDYDAGTTYAEGDEVDFEGHVWRSLQAGNTGHTPPTGEAADDWWFDTGANNPMRMFDASIQSQSAADGTIEVELDIPLSHAASVVYIENLQALSLNVSVPDAAFSVDVDLDDSSGISDIWEYLMFEIRRKTWALVEGVPTYAGPLQITIDNGEGEARCGDCVVARPDQLGWTRWSGEAGFLTYAEKEQDPNVEGGWRIGAGELSDTFDAQIWVLNNRLDFVRDKLREAFRQRRVYVLDDRWKATIINGFYTGDVRFVMERERRSLLNLPLASLT